MPTLANNSGEQTIRLQSVAAVLWPSFLAATVLTTVVFAAVDPHLVFPAVGRSATYTLSFFTFWSICAGACWSTLYYLRVVPDRVTATVRALDSDKQAASDDL